MDPRHNRLLREAKRRETCEQIIGFIAAALITVGMTVGFFIQLTN